MAHALYLIGLLVIGDQRGKCFRSKARSKMGDREIPFFHTPRFTKKRAVGKITNLGKQFRAKKLIIFLKRRKATCELFFFFETYIRRGFGRPTTESVNFSQSIAKLREFPDQRYQPLLIIELQKLACKEDSTLYATQLE